MTFASNPARPHPGSNGAQASRRSGPIGAGTWRHRDGGQWSRTPRPAAACGGNSPGVPVAYGGSLQSRWKIETASGMREDLGYGGGA
jgi:hypothetical protein